MTTSRKPRARKRARPAADGTCTLTRTVERDGRQLQLWTCSAPAPAKRRRRPELRVAPEEVVEWIGRRDWRFVRVHASDIARGDAFAHEPGWWFNAVECDVRWHSNEPIGPYATLEEARADAACGAEADAEAEHEDDSWAW